MKRRTLVALSLTGLVVTGCPEDAPAPPPPTVAPTATSTAPKTATPEEAKAFMTKVDEELKALFVKRERAGWVSSNFITSDTEEISAEADRETMEYLARTIKAATRFDGLELEPALARQFHLLKLAGTLPAPNDPEKTAELAKITSGMQSAYGKGKYCPTEDGALRKALAKDEKNAKALACDTPGEAGKGVSLGVLTALMADSRDEAALREAWIGWRKIAPDMKDAYARYVQLGNEGAKEIGFDDVGQLWRSGYDMKPEAFEKEIERIYGEVKPFYEQVHCYVRKKLAEKYGEELVPKGKPIPAHLLGNMWSQTWNNVADLATPYPDAASIDVTKALEKKGYDEVKMVKTAEGFFTSLGLDALPDTFWERSLFTKPADRDVVCHASAWDVHYNDDLRIKMCIQRTGEELRVIHHELGHNYYYHYYFKEPVLFQQGANDGFHEAIGDAIALSITPGYLDNLMKMALEKVAFLPFGKLIDQWRWNVFAGKVKPEAYNSEWWKLRAQYQGIEPPEARTDEQFDPGAKYHVPANVPYIRYFLAFIYQFQFQRALCKAAGHEGPLHKCSIYGNEEAGKKLKALLAMGASKPWQDALQAMSGERKADPAALLEYFRPLRKFLEEETKGEQCGW